MENCGNMRYLDILNLISHKYKLDTGCFLNKCIPEV